MNTYLAHFHSTDEDDPGYGVLSVEAEDFLEATQKALDFGAAQTSPPVELDGLSSVSAVAEFLARQMVEQMTNPQEDEKPQRRRHHHETPAHAQAQGTGMYL